ncbi:hypothetical protein PPERSA_09526 [Pseudocohnilembus persalinus]|uniref:Transmembrane protein n=1 Tax=Pseudocohnilembus persalinus TaxID=266149 RepID=A0A0V0QFL0_PSEPJ|nr:hypothetical protein PPERSA_09526 [Pseudocohnilembus persalinus]|eukprot:KRX00920.1 hypothetical protein PPERSA_09526 [Pseudocohnilembus persalinus]
MDSQLKKRIIFIIFLAVLEITAVNYYNLSQRQFYVTNIQEKCVHDVNQLNDQTLEEKAKIAVQCRNDIMHQSRYKITSLAYEYSNFIKEKSINFEDLVEKYKKRIENENNTIEQKEVQEVQDQQENQFVDEEEAQQIKQTLMKNNTSVQNVQQIDKEKETYEAILKMILKAAGRSNNQVTLISQYLAGIFLIISIVVIFVIYYHQYINLKQIAVYGIFTCVGFLIKEYIHLAMLKDKFNYGINVFIYIMLSVLFYYSVYKVVERQDLKSNKQQKDD